MFKEKCCGQKSKKFCVQKLHFESCAVYETMWKIIVGTGRPQMRKACLYNAHSFSTVTWFRERPQCYITPLLLDLYILGYI
jgi:hypothetical protein